MGEGVRAITLSLPCPINKQQRPVKKNKIHLLSAYYAPGSGLNTKHELSPGIIKTILAQKSDDCHFTDGVLRLGVNCGGAQGCYVTAHSQAVSGPDGEH